MATLITGAGLIGSHVARLLADRGESVYLYDVNPVRDHVASVVDPERVGLIRGDVLDLEGLGRVLREHRVDRILHTAALLTAGVREAPYHGVRVNVLGTATLLEAARLAGIRRVVLTSSSTVYYALFNEPAAAPYPEDFPMRVVSQRPTSLYAATKVAGEHLGLLYSDLYGLDAVVLRFAAVLGLWPGPMGGMASRLARALLEPAIRGEPAVIDDPRLVWKGGDEFVDVRDAAAGAVAALFADRPQARVYSIGMGVLHGFDDFVQAARAVVPGFRVAVRVPPAGGFAGYPLLRPQASDNSAARRELCFAPAHDLASALAACAAYLREERAR